MQWTTAAARGAGPPGSRDIGSGLSQLEMDVGSLLGVGDDSSWDRPAGVRAGIPAGGRGTGAPLLGSGAAAAAPGAGFSAFHELFPPPEMPVGER